MRKYLIGAIFGIALTLASTSYAEDIKSLIGVKVQGEFPVKIEGKQLEKHAIVIDGTSYLPNRSIADALNMEISFNADLGIELKKKENKPVETMNSEATPSAEQLTQPSPTPTTNPTLTLDELNQKIAGLEDKIYVQKYFLTGGDPSTLPERSKQLVADLESQLTELEKQKAELTQ